MAYSQVSVKASVIAGAVTGFVLWILVAPGVVGATTSGAGMMGYVMGYATIGFLGALLGAVLGAVLGAIAASVYNWSLKIK